MVLEAEVEEEVVSVGTHKLKLLHHMPRTGRTPTVLGTFGVAAQDYSRVVQGSFRMASKDRLATMRDRPSPLLLELLRT